MWRGAPTADATDVVTDGCHLLSKTFGLGVLIMGVLLPHVGPASTSQHSALHKNNFKDDLKIIFKDDLPGLQKPFPFTRMMWEMRLRLDGPHLLFCADSGPPF